MAKRGCLGKLFFTVIALGLLCCGLLFGLGYLEYQKAIKEVPLNVAVATIQQDENYTTTENSSPYFLEAIVAVEDKRFYDHGAVDPLGLGRAVLINLKNLNFSEGGSTITQQVAKNLYFTNEKRITRKIAELFVALDLEKAYTKNEILEFYSNIIYFGQGCYGIKEAAFKYYDKAPSDLNFEEAAVLAGIPQAPSIYNPIDSPEKSAERTEAVMKILTENDIMPQE